MDSYAGDPGGQLYKIDGRATRWKNIYRLRNPDIGAHYYGFYGHADEDTYFEAITGDEHKHHGEEFHRYPYEVKDAGLRIMHFSDVRPHARRLQRMKACMVNQDKEPSLIDELAENNPRVTLQSGYGFKFTPAEYPEIFKTWRKHPCSL